MGIGSTVRRLCGPFEHQVADVYRSIFFDVDDLVETVRSWAPDARRIVEIGCGEGAVTERLAAAFPAATITGVDITPRVGRLYRGPADQVRFLNCTLQDLAEAEPGRYDLAIMSDVLHHVPMEHRDPLLAAVKRVLAPSGRFVFKDWARDRSPIHYASYASDRYLTGDRISYMRIDEARTALARSFGAPAIVEEKRLRPWRNNFAMLLQP